MTRGELLPSRPGADPPADRPGDLAVSVPAPSGGIATAGRSAPALPERTLADLLAEVILRGKSPQTRRAYRADLEDFLIWRLGGPLRLPADPEALRADPAVGAALQAALQSLQLMTEGDIAAYLRRLGGDGPGARPLQPATINRRLTPLRLLFARLHRYGLIAVDPMEDIKGHKLGRASATLWLTRPQARALEDACRGDTLRDLRDRALIVVMLATGLRSSEALGLAIADLGQVEGYHVAWITGKGGARERVKLQDKARRALDAWLPRLPDRVRARDEQARRALRMGRSPTRGSPRPPPACPATAPRLARRLAYRATPTPGRCATDEQDALDGAATAYRVHGPLLPRGAEIHPAGTLRRRRPVGSALPHSRAPAPLLRDAGPARRRLPLARQGAARRAATPTPRRRCATPTSRTPSTTTPPIM